MSDKLCIKTTVTNCQKLCNFRINPGSSGTVNNARQPLVRGRNTFHQLYQIRTITLFRDLHQRITGLKANTKNAMSIQKSRLKIQYNFKGCVKMKYNLKRAETALYITLINQIFENTIDHFQIAASYTRRGLEKQRLYVVISCKSTQINTQSALNRQDLWLYQSKIKFIQQMYWTSRYKLFKTL